MSRCFVAFCLMTALACSPVRTNLTIQLSSSPTDPEKLAAKEIARYVMLCTGDRPTVTTSPSLGDIVLCLQGSPLEKKLFAELKNLPDEPLGASTYSINSIEFRGKRAVILRGGSPHALLYSAYRFIEALGVRFYLHDDVLPPKKPYAPPELHLVESPRFELRGILPFHDFPEGPDWWSLDDYKAVMTQLAKMRMNFIGFHTYPSIPFNGHSRPEPMVWHGTTDQVLADGTVKSAYPVLHFHTGAGTWGYFPMKTSDYTFGAAMLFDVDDFGADYMRQSSPWPHTEAENLQIFNSFGAWQKDMFTFARRLGVKTCVGTETPLNIPEEVRAQLEAQGIDPKSEQAVQKVYEGTFERIKRLHPLDYYWFWTPEYWTWEAVPDADVEATERDLMVAVKAAQAVDAPFTLATCGWVLGPPQDRAQFDRLLPKEMPFSCINREVGFTPVDSNFARITDRPTWAISWLEDDPALISPQLWVGRVRRDAVDAERYGCSGFMGIHWRTEILSPALAATAQVGWSFGNWASSVNPATRDLPVDDFYLDWATAQFGPVAAAEIAAVFSRLDGGPLFLSGKTPRRANLYRTSDWAGQGPGGILINPQPWSEVEKEFLFVDELETLREKIDDAEARERFDYWLNTFLYDRKAAQVGCMLGEMERLIRRLPAAPEAKKKAVRDEVLPLKARIEQEWGNMVALLLSTVNTTGALGTIANLEQHNLRTLRRLTPYDSLLSAALGEPLPPPALPAAYTGEPRLIVPTRRSVLEAGEPLRLRAFVLSASPAESVTLFHRRIGQGRFRPKPFAHSARGVFAVQVPAAEVAGDIEYYIEARADGRTLRFPVTAPERNRTVIVW